MGSEKAGRSRAPDDGQRGQPCRVRRDQLPGLRNQVQRLARNAEKRVCTGAHPQNRQARVPSCIALMASTPLSGLILDKTLVSSNHFGVANN